MNKKKEKNNFTWQHIEFSDGSNPYICYTAKNFRWMKSHYELINIKDNFWMAYPKHYIC